MNGQLVTAVAVLSMTAYGAAAYVLHTWAQRERTRVVAEDRGLARYSPYFIWVPYVVLAARPGPALDVPEALRWVGLALVIAGPLFMIWAGLTLGRHYDVEVLVTEAHEVVRSGPYRLVRHPIYFGMGAHFFGACLASGNLLFVAGTVLVAFPALYQRAAAEERLLRAELGDAYERYAREVPMLVPGIARADPSLR